MPSRLIQLNGMNVNAGGQTKFHAICSQRRRSAFAVGEVARSAKNSLCNFDHVTKIAAGASQMRSTIFINQASDALLRYPCVEPI
jgi:hypothetical protein